MMSPKSFFRKYQQEQKEQLVHKSLMLMIGKELLDQMCLEIIV